VVAGSTRDNYGVEKPQLMLCTFEQDLIPISAIVVEDVDHCPIHIFKQFGSKNRDYILAAAIGWIFLFEVRNNLFKEISRRKTMNKTKPTDICIIGSSILVKFDSEITTMRYSTDDRRKIPTLELFEFLDIEIDSVAEDCHQIGEIKFGGGGRSAYPSQYNSYKSYNSGT
jgi:hypothetical protein